MENECKTALAALINELGMAELCRLVDAKEATVRVWVHRGCISKKSAQIIHDSDLNFTREFLRPDVKVWY